MQSRRLEQVSELLRSEAAAEISRALAETNGTLVSITRVWIAPDLSCADLFVLPVNPNDAPGKALNAVKKVLPRVQRSLAGRLELRRTPRLRVRVDDGQLAENKMDDLLGRLRREREEREGTAS